jgi:hypothetical protein
MDISKLKELHTQIAELRKKADATDSKRETYQIQREIDALESEFEDVTYELLDEIPDDIDLRITVNKVVPFDTTDFKSWVVDNILQRDDLEDLDLIEELKEAVKEDFDPLYEIDNDDVNVEFEDVRYK